MLRDRPALAQRLQGLQRRQRRQLPIDQGLAKLQQAVARSHAEATTRRQQRPPITYPEALPVSAHRDTIAAAIQQHQVVIVAGETGSGKTTQLPKICLDLDRGIYGMIGHTQPRRLAARSVANRIASELGSGIGAAVGYKVRFTDRATRASYIKLMTDGILLAEAQHDRQLRHYDTIIIDEAHERSLNIDFLLGYLKQLLPQRPELKLIITSATINTAAFSTFFDGAQVISVSGRTYPVEVRYRPLLAAEIATTQPAVSGVNDAEAAVLDLDAADADQAAAADRRDRDQPQAILDAVDELARDLPLGDILLFLPGEREIRDTTEALRRHAMRDTEVLPLFSRLSAAEQDRVFQPHRGRRIILATNVAETSLTVPGIRAVIDTGEARISRYSHRTKVQRLPIESISQAAANQRAGRCGRLGPGICIRLYSESDYLARPEQSDPEILRTNLASVILQMATLQLGDIAHFPFLAPPDSRRINDGYQLLHELGAVDERRRITAIGQQLARLPVDPRIGRMLIAAASEGALQEVAVIAAALSIQDPRERPLAAQQQADQAHAPFRDERSDFLAYLNLWRFYHEQARHLSRSKLRQLCQQHYLSYVRLREWHDIHGQILQLTGDLKLTRNSEPADYDAIHRALLTGLLGQVAQRDEEPPPQPNAKRPKRRPLPRYLGARNVKLQLFPGSGVKKQPPKWLMAAELIETSALYARSVAAIQPQWLETLAAHLIKRSWSEPHWEQRPAQVAAFEQQTLYGLIVVPRRKVNYGPIDSSVSRQLFIRHALVEGAFRSSAPCLQQNRALLADLEQLEAKSRRRDWVVDEEQLYAFYDARLPEGIYSGQRFERWRRRAERNDPHALCMSREQLLHAAATPLVVADFPDQITINTLSLPLHYHFEPGSEADGVTVQLPLTALAELPAAPFEWLVPGLLEAKIIALIKSLPKALRRNFVPAVNFAQAVLAALADEGRGAASGAALLPELTRQLLRMSGVEVAASAWDLSQLPPHLLMRFEVVDERGRPLRAGRDLAALRQQVGERVRSRLQQRPETTIERDQIKRWDFGDLPERVEVRRAGMTLRGYPALTEQADGSLSIRLHETPQAAATAGARGAVRLLLQEQRDKVRWLRRNLPNWQRSCLLYTGLGSCDELTDDLLVATAATLLLGDQPDTIRDAAIWQQRSSHAAAALVASATANAERVSALLQQRRELLQQIQHLTKPNWLLSLRDAEAQLNGLLPRRFLLQIPQAQLPELARYLRALARRLEKLPLDPQRDQQLCQQIAPLQQMCREAWPTDPIAEPPSAALQHFRWLLEELRVSLFAQELGTRERVSITRLSRYWQAHWPS